MNGGSNSFVGKANNHRLVQAIEGDAILSGEKKVNFIKFDIEGFEPFAGRGLSETLRKHFPKVLCEFNPRCLQSHANIDPFDFARQIFDRADCVFAVKYNGVKNTVRSADELMFLWKEKNVIAAKVGLPDGMLHFDLLFDVKK